MIGRRTVSSQAVNSQVRILGSDEWLLSGTIALLGACSILGCSNSYEAHRDTERQATAAVSQRVSQARIANEELEYGISSRSPARGTNDDGEIRVLMIGNSHTRSHNLSGIVASLVANDEVDDELSARLIALPNAFLADHLARPKTVQILRETKWDVVILQGQKYSTSGRYSYPTDAARELTRIARENEARVIMFPEWRRKGHKEEGKRVHRLHESIAAETGAEVAPIGLAWDAALEEWPELVLHSSDGNHCNPKGAYLNACVLYAVITGRNPSGVDVGGRVKMSDKERSFLQRIAWETYQRREQPDN